MLVLANDHKRGHFGKSLLADGATHPISDGWLGEYGRRNMAARKQFLTAKPVDPALSALLESARKRRVTEKELHEQSISFAYGNAPVDATRITKESVRRASLHIRLAD